MSNHQMFDAHGSTTEIKTDMTDSLRENCVYSIQGTFLLSPDNFLIYNFFLIVQFNNFDLIFCLKAL